MFYVLLGYGLLSGYFAGFLGLGAGAFLMPFFMLLGIPYHVAVYASLMAVFLSSIVGAILNCKDKKPMLEPCIVMSITASIFALIGSFYLIHILSPVILMIIFSGLMFLNADFFKSASAKSKKHEFSDTVKINHHRNFPLYIVIGICVGLAASLLGIGGGIIIIPLLIRFARFPVKDAVMIAVIVMIFSTLFAMMPHIITNSLPWYIGGGTAIGATIGSFLGSIALKYVRQSIIVKCNYIVSFILGLIMLIKAIMY